MVQKFTFPFLFFCQQFHCPIQLVRLLTSNKQMVVLLSWDGFPADCIKQTLYVMMNIFSLVHKAQLIVIS